MHVFQYVYCCLIALVPQVSYYEFVRALFLFFAFFTSKEIIWGNCIEDFPQIGERALEKRNMYDFETIWSTFLLVSVFPEQRLRNWKCPRTGQSP